MGLALRISLGSFQAPVSTCNFPDFSVVLESQLALLTSFSWKITMTILTSMCAQQKQDMKMEKVILTASSPWESHVVVNMMDSFEPQDEEQGRNFIFLF